MERFDGIIIFSDFDNTLTSKGESIGSEIVVNPKNFEAVRFFTERGGRFVMATGRNPFEVQWLKEKMPIDDIIVCTNGSFFSIEKQGAVRSRFLDEGFDEILYTIIEEFPSIKNLRIVDGNFVHHNWTNGEKPLFEHIAEAKKPYYKITFDGKRDEEYCEKFLAYLKGRFSDRYTVEASFFDFFEIYSKDAGKHVGVCELASLYNARAFICVGDQENDIKMIKCATLGVCVGDGVRPVKDAADYVCAPSTEGAIADVIYKLYRDEITVL